MSNPGTEMYDLVDELKCEITYLREEIEALRKALKELPEAIEASGQFTGDLESGSDTE